MQEEVTSKTIALTAKCVKLTARTLLKMILMFLKHRKNSKNSPDIPQGLQTVKELARQGKGMSALDMNDNDMKLFHQTMKKYGVDYAVMTNKETSPPTHTIFFKGRDADAITKAFEEYSSKLINKLKNKSTDKEITSVIEDLKKIKIKPDKAKVKIPKPEQTR